MVEVLTYFRRLPEGHGKKRGDWGGFNNEGALETEKGMGDGGQG